MQILEICRYCKYANIGHVQTGVPEQLQLLASEQLLFSRSSDHFCCTDRGSVKASYFFSFQPIFIFRIRSTFYIDLLEMWSLRGGGPNRSLSSWDKVEFQPIYLFSEFDQPFLLCKRGSFQACRPKRGTGNDWSKDAIFVGFIKTFIACIYAYKLKFFEEIKRTTSAMKLFKQIY